VTVLDRDACANLGILATPEQVADAFKATGIPRAPDVRPAADELREPELDPKSPHTAGGFAAAMGIGLVAVALPFL
jgi:hypothetical protein